MQPIIKQLFQNLPLHPEELKTISQKLKQRTLKKGETLLQPGDRVHHFYYLHRGRLRTYFIDPKGREYTLQFAIKGWWISNYIALFGQHDL